MVTTPEETESREIPPIEPSTIEETQEEKAASTKIVNELEESSEESSEESPEESSEESSEESLEESSEESLEESSKESSEESSKESSEESLEELSEESLAMEGTSSTKESEPSNPVLVPNIDEITVDDTITEMVLEMLEDSLTEKPELPKELPLFPAEEEPALEKLESQEELLDESTESQISGNEVEMTIADIAQPVLDTKPAMEDLEVIDSKISNEIEEILDNEIETENDAIIEMTPEPEASLTDQPEAIDNLEEVMEVEVDEIEEILDDDTETENDAIIELAPELEAASTDQPEAIVNPEEVTELEVDEIEEILDDDTETEIDAIIEMAPEPEESSTDQPEAIDNAEVEVDEIDDEEESLPSTEKPEQPKQLSFFSENDKMEEVSDKIVPDSDLKDLIPRQDNDVIVEEDVEITTMKPVIEIVTNSSKLPKSIEIIVQDVRLEEELQTNEIVQAEGKQNINLEDEDHSIVSNDEAFVNEILEDNTNPDKNEEKPVVDTTEQYIEITTILP